MAAKLRAVSPEDRPGEPKTVTQAADSGSARDLLVAMRARVAEAVESPNTLARDLASLTKRLLEIVREIEAIDAQAAQEAQEREDGATPDDEWEAV